VIYTALLRGINVGGKLRLSMKELRSLLMDLGLKQVRTYIQSRNAIFQCQARDHSQFGGAESRSISGV
jgi:uncharacterized protein (DUF1697 family)